MNIFLEDSELEEIKPLSPTEDKGVVITPTVGERGESKTDIQKEITAFDAMIIGPSEAAKINGVAQSSASKYSTGKDIADPDTRIRVLGMRNDIQDLAITKLMDTLNLLDPSDMEKPRDKIALLSGLSSLVEKISPKKEDENVKQVHLHLYAPKQRTEKDYEVIEA